MTTILNKLSLAFAGLVLSFSSGLAHAADSPSFDCKKASSSVEKAICGDPKLMELDVDLAASYKRGRSESSEKRSKWIVSTQREWLKRRKTCPLQGMQGCLVGRYTDRLEVLEWTEELSADGDINGDGILDLVILTQKKPSSSKAFEIYLGSKSEGYKKVFESSVLVPAVEENQFAPLEAIEINDKGVLSLYFEMAYSMGSWMRETHTYRVRFEDERFRVIGHDFFSHYRNRRSSYAESWNFLSNRMFEKKYSEDEELFEKKYSFKFDGKIYIDDIKNALHGDLGIGTLESTLTSQSENHPTKIETFGKISATNNPSKKWQQKNLYGNDSSGTVLGKVTLSKGESNEWTILITNQSKFSCKIYFDEKGNPALLKACELTEPPSWLSEQPLSVTPDEIILNCTARSKEIVCNGSYRHDLQSDQAYEMTMTIARKK
ncbi:hypothetical protein OAH95_00555 [Burkholderiaceae bacterium]|nr:hypothetical protein [Burkholderiaceae bacterium]